MQLLDFAAMFDESVLGAAEASELSVAFVIKLPKPVGAQSSGPSLELLGANVGEEEGVTLFNAKYQGKTLVWQAQNGENVGLDLSKSLLGEMPLHHVMPAFFFAQDELTGEVVAKGAIQLID